MREDIEEMIEISDWLGMRGENVVRGTIEVGDIFCDGVTDLLNQLVTCAGDFVAYANSDCSLVDGWCHHGCCKIRVRDGAKRQKNVVKLFILLYFLCVQIFVRCV